MILTVATGFDWIDCGNNAASMSCSAPAADARVVLDFLLNGLILNHASGGCGFRRIVWAINQKFKMRQRRLFPAGLSQEMAKKCASFLYGKQA